MRLTLMQSNNKNSDTEKERMMKRLFMGAVLFASVMGIGGAALAADGAGIFNAKCVPCHGAGGAGTAMAPAFKGNEFIASSSVEDISAVIKNGRAGAEKKYPKFVIAMPAQKSLSDEDVAAVASYLKTLAE